jgi:hypothetical protein
VVVFFSFVFLFGTDKGEEERHELEMGEKGAAVRLGNRGTVEP